MNWFNDDTTKTASIYAGSGDTVFVFQPGVLKVTFAFGAGTASVQGM